ncbi:MAG: response regulator [Nitrospiraceae bacterium]
MARILLIDDNAVFVGALAVALQVRDATNAIDTALTAEDGARLLHARDYDVVITDFRLSGSTGLTLVKACKALRPDTPVILMTGHGDREIEESAADQGAYAFIHKPIDVDVLSLTIARALLRRSILQRGGRGRSDRAELEAMMLVMKGDSILERIHQLQVQRQQKRVAQEPGKDS